jgi:hypothetical protein
MYNQIINLLCWMSKKGIKVSKKGIKVSKKGIKVSRKGIKSKWVIDRICVS